MTPAHYSYRRVPPFGRQNPLSIEKQPPIGAALIKQHKIVFGKRRSFGYAVSPLFRSCSKDAEGNVYLLFPITF